MLFELLFWMLIDGLGDENFKVRENSYKILKEWNIQQDLRKGLYFAGSFYHEDPEVKTRIRGLIEDYETLTMEMPSLEGFIKEGGYYGWFEFENEKVKDIAIRMQVVYDSGNGGCSRTNDWEERASWVVREYAKHLFLMGKTREEVIEILNAAREKEK